MFEEYVRRVPIKRIKDEDEYKKQKEKLDNYIDERQWLSKTENPLDEVASQIRGKIKELDEVEKESKKEADILKSIHYLQVKFDMIKDGSYESRLIDNIRAQTMMIDEYELRKKFPSFGKFFGALVTGNKDAKKILGYQILRERGNIVEPESLDVLPNYSVLKNIAHTHGQSFVDIDAKKLEEDANKNRELGMVPYQDVATGLFDKRISSIGNETYNELQQKVDTLQPRDEVKLNANKDTTHVEVEPYKHIEHSNEKHQIQKEKLDKKTHENDDLDERYN